MIYLLDANMAIALAARTHEDHSLARNWLGRSKQIAMCPVVEGALVRYLVRERMQPSAIQQILDSFYRERNCQFWADDLSYRAVDLGGIMGHRQVTDTYLVALAQAHGGRLATLDRALARRFPQATELVSPAPPT